MTRKTITIPILLLFLSLQCFPQSFTQVSQFTGIEALHEAKNYLGGGVAFVDFDRDGHLDSYVTTDSNGGEWGGCEQELLDEKELFRTVFLGSVLISQVRKFLFI